LSSLDLGLLEGGDYTALGAKAGKSSRNGGASVWKFGGRRSESGVLVHFGDAAEAVRRKKIRDSSRAIATGAGQRRRARMTMKAAVFSFPRVACAGGDGARIPNLFPAAGDRMNWQGAAIGPN